MQEIVSAVPLRTQVADIIRRMIMDGELECGKRVSERQISVMLNVSTTPVKEAFRMLQSEGLLYSVPRSGSYVSERSMDNLMQYSLMRSALDGVAARLAAEKAGEEDIDYMRKELALSRELIEAGGEREEISTHNLNFHVRIRESSGNPFLVQQIGMIADIDNSMRRVVNANDAKELMLRQMEHENILQAISMRKPDLAEQIMVAHVRDGARDTLRGKNKQEMT